MIDYISSSSQNLAQLILKKLEQKQFDKMDGDGDGQISKSEFSAFANIMKTKMSQTATIETATGADKLFSKIDTDSDDQISQGEFEQFISDEIDKLADQLMVVMPFGRPRVSQTTAMKEDSDKIFARIDTDKDEKISKTEFEDYLSAQKAEAGHRHHMHHMHQAAGILELLLLLAEEAAEEDSADSSSDTTASTTTSTSTATSTVAAGSATYSTTAKNSA
jgi:Ca2+-binding EF-hand superfamily protein